MEADKQPAAAGPVELVLGPLPEVADAGRVLAWARERPRRPANTAFTRGAERQAAYWIEWAEAAERERCAQVCEATPIIGRSDPEAFGFSNALETCAAAIRRA